jgi:hypothetical protein
MYKPARSTVVIYTSQAIVEKGDPYAAALHSFCLPLARWHYLNRLGIF